MNESINSRKIAKKKCEHYFWFHEKQEEKWKKLNNKKQTGFFVSQKT